MGNNEYIAIQNCILNPSNNSQATIYAIYRAYYTVAGRYEFYVRVARTVSNE